VAAHSRVRPCQHFQVPAARAVAAVVLVVASAAEGQRAGPVRTVPLLHDG